MLWLKKEKQKKKKEERQGKRFTHHGEAEWEIPRGQTKATFTKFINRELLIGSKARIYPTSATDCKRCDRVTTGLDLVFWLRALMSQAYRRLLLQGWVGNGFLKPDHFILFYFPLRLPTHILSLIRVFIYRLRRGGRLQSIEIVCLKV